MTLSKNEHENIMLQILKDIYTDKEISPFLGFKGGTAAYFFYNLERFSVDLDFDLLNKEKEDLVFEKIKTIIAKYGKIKDQAKKRFNLFFLLSYKEGLQNIKIEINRKELGSSYELKSYLGISMKIMAKEDMVAHKLVAMEERMGRSNRDIFDVWFFLSNNWAINQKIVEQRTKMSFNSFLKNAVESLEKLPNTNILGGMGELLNQKQKAWVKNNLKREVIFLLKLKTKQS